MIEFNPFEWNFYLAERLHMEFDYRAEELGLIYHPKWIDEESFCIVDNHGNLCMDPSIYQFLNDISREYEFVISNSGECHKIRKPSSMS